MRSFILLLCGLFLRMSCLAQVDLPGNEVSDDQFKSNFSSFIASLKSSKTSDLKILRKLFNQAHQDYLKTYVAYSQVNDIFEKGNYDCLSGTYFFASALDDLHIPYKIVETNYHIFLIVNTSRGEVLIETTDRINGFVRNRKAREERISGYLQPRSNSSNTSLYLSKIRIFHELQSRQLPGLLYFNRAVEAFNKNDLSNCCLFLEQAWKIYDNQRIEAFAPILLQSLQTSALEKSSKEKLISLIQDHQQSYHHTIASR